MCVGERERAVSYTHLDVYKRQRYGLSLRRERVANKDCNSPRVRRVILPEEGIAWKVQAVVGS